MNNTQVKAIRDLWADVTSTPAEAPDASAIERNTRRAWELAHVVDVPGVGPVSIAALRQAFEKVQPGDGWKNPVEAQVYGQDLLITLFAIEFYLGCLATAVLTHQHQVNDRVTRHNLVHPVVGSLVREHADYIVRSQGYAC